MKVRLVVAVGAALCLQACGASCWTRGNFTQSDWQRDRYECERDMRQSGYYGSGIVGAMNAKGFFEECLEARGYYKTDRSVCSR